MLKVLFLLAGLFCLAAGIWGFANYFQLQGPSDEQLHALALRNVSNVTVEPEIPGSKRIDNIWLETTNNERIRYRNRFPHSFEVRQLDTNLSLLLDRSNRVWAVKKADGAVLSRNYFERYNNEAKSVRLVCSPFVAAIGATFLLVYFCIHRGLQTVSAAQRTKLEAYSHGLRLPMVLCGYLIAYAILAQWLLKFLAPRVVSLLWILTGGVLMALVSKKNRPPAS